MQTDYAKQNLPAVQQLTSDVLEGRNLAVNPFVAGLYAPIQAATDRTVEQIRQRTPRGPAQDYAISQAMQTGGMQRSQLDVQQRQQILAALMNMLGGYNPQAQIGSKSSKPAFGINMGIGPFSYNTAF
jgi:hypothetical protein